jgi:hypothetical protein
MDTVVSVCDVIFQQALGCTGENHKRSQDSVSTGPGLNQRPPENKTAASAIRSIRVAQRFVRKVRNAIRQNRKGWNLGKTPLPLTTGKYLRRAVWCHQLGFLKYFSFFSLFYYFFFSTWLILNRVGSMNGREGTNNHSPSDLFRKTKTKHYNRTAVKPPTSRTALSKKCATRSTQTGIT